MFYELKCKQDLGAENVRHYREENDHLRKDLDARPKEKDILDKFRGSPASTLN